MTAYQALDFAATKMTAIMAGRATAIDAQKAKFCVETACEYKNLSHSENDRHVREWAAKAVKYMVGVDHPDYKAVVAC